MHKIEVYLEETQRDMLQDIAYLMTKQTKKRVSVSELVRKAVVLWMDTEGKKTLQKGQ